MRSKREIEEMREQRTRWAHFYQTKILNCPKMNSSDLKPAQNPKLEPKKELKERPIRKSLSLEPPVSVSIFGLNKVRSMQSLKKADIIKLSDKSQNGSFKARKMPTFP